jgi:hypothetical protein
MGERVLRCLLLDNNRINKERTNGFIPSGHKIRIREQRGFKY